MFFSTPASTSLVTYVSLTDDTEENLKGKYGMIWVRDIKHGRPFLFKTAGWQPTDNVRLSMTGFNAETKPKKTIVKGSEKDGTCCAPSPGQTVTLHSARPSKDSWNPHVQ